MALPQLRLDQTVAPPDATERSRGNDGPDSDRIGEAARFLPIAGLRSRVTFTHRKMDMESPANIG